MLKSILIGLLVLLAIGSLKTSVNIPVHAQLIQETSLIHRHLLDDATGNSLGWDPDNTTKSFGIFDTKFNSETSVVIVNTFQENFVVCNVDWRSWNFFEVNCGVNDDNAPAPAEGAELHYIIVNMPLSPPEPPVQPPANVTQRMQMANQTQPSP